MEGTDKEVISCHEEIDPQVKTGEVTVGKPKEISLVSLHVRGEFYVPCGGFNLQ